jgi:hypothetical protein
MVKFREWAELHSELFLLGFGGARFLTPYDYKLILMVKYLNHKGCKTHVHHSSETFYDALN